MLLMPLASGRGPALGRRLMEIVQMLDFECGIFIEEYERKAANAKPLSTQSSYSHCLDAPQSYQT